MTLARIHHMKRILLLLILGAPLALPADLTVVLTPLRGHLYVVEDNFYLKENSMVYVGDNFVTVIGPTWTPETAKLLAAEVKKVTPKPITEVIDTNYHPDRAGGNAYFKSIGAKIISTKLTSDLLIKHWDEMVRYEQKGAPSYPTLPLVLPDKTFAGDFELPRRRGEGDLSGSLAHPGWYLRVFSARESSLRELHSQRATRQSRFRGPLRVSEDS